MSFLLVATYYYPVWHYGPAFRGIFVIWMNYLWFLYNFFSVGLLFRTLFSPWKRLSETYHTQGRGIDFEQMAGALVVNIFMRLLGAVVRRITIAMGLAVLAIAFAAGLLFFVVWALLPAIAVALIAFGLFLIF